MPGHVIGLLDTFIFWYSDHRVINFNLIFIQTSTSPVPIDLSHTSSSISLQLHVLPRTLGVQHTPLTMAIPLSVTASVLNNWADDMRSHSHTNAKDHPNYYAHSPQDLITSSFPTKFSLGTGSHILQDALTSFESIVQEVIIVTCFWAKSESQQAICSTLRKLSDNACAHNRIIQVRICFSSRSIFQKLFQTSSLRGKIYPPSSWASIGLPDLGDIPGIHLIVKCIFVRPFSVAHSKFIIVDRNRAYMPSCNVSWENWFEGCIEMEGDVVLKLFDFWASFWSGGDASLPPILIQEGAGQLPPQTHSSALEEPNSPLIDQILFTSETRTPTTTILLPSPHHINPHFHPFWTSHPSPPTPLNTFLLHVFDAARETIYIQTPNLTSRPIVSAIHDALQRGVNIHILTSRRLMILEQLFTAGTITEFEVWKLRRKCRQLSSKYLNADLDLESSMPRPGVLRIGYYRSRKGHLDDPVKSHLKLAVVDAQVVILGSGNMDRASWYTSQELGVAFLSPVVARDVGESLAEALEGRVEYIY